MKKQIELHEIIYPTYKITKPIRLIELFGGIGSQAKALTNLKANFEHYKLIEFDRYAIKSYNSIHNTNFKTLDITKINAKDLEIKNKDKYEYIMTYSFPCQDLSLIGTKKGMSKGSNTRSGLLWEVERLLDEMEELPQVLLMENVPQVIGKKNIGDFTKWLNKLTELGYSNYIDVLNAKDYGIPQNRKRVFMISILGKYNYTFPEKIELEKTLKDYVNFEIQIPPHILKSFIEKGGDFGTRFRTKGILANTLVTNSSYAANINTFYTKDFKDYNKQEIVDKKIQPYALSSKECWLLMGFSEEDYYKAEECVSKAQLFKQAGNSIVVNVLEHIFKQLL